jgi:hypothetical protein
VTRPFVLDNVVRGLARIGGKVQRRDVNNARGEILGDTQSRAEISCDGNEAKEHSIAKVVPIALIIGNDPIATSLFWYDGSTESHRRFNDRGATSFRQMYDWGTESHG